MAQSTWVDNGTFLANNKLSAQMRKQAQPTFVWRQFCDVKEGGAGKGDFVYFSKSVQMDTAGGTLTETDTIPKNLIKHTKGSVQILEYGGGTAFTEKLETLAEFDMRNNYTQWLVNDHRRVIDSAVAAQFVTAKYRAVCTSTSSTVFTTNGTFTATSAADMSDTNVRDVIDYMRKKWIPGVGQGKTYSCVASTNSLRGLYNQMQAMMQYAKPEYLYNDEVGEFYGCRFVRDLSYLVDTKGSGTQYGEACFFGAESIIEAIALPEEVRYEEKDAGRDKALIWYSLRGQAKMWDTGDDVNSAGKGFERIVYLGSV